MNPLPHRVYIHASQFADRWFVQYLEGDLKSPIGRLYTYSSIDQVREILRRADCSLEEWGKFEEGIRCWKIGGCFVSLTSEQYNALRGNGRTQ